MPASIKHLTDKKLNLNSLLARWQDGLYYTAAIVKCDKVNKKCLVCFEDGSEVWVKNRDVHIQLTLDQLNEDEDIVCCICDDGNSEAPNEIILCDVCQQGYHQKCHNPPVDSSKIDESEDNSDHKDWFCATCSYILNQSNRAKLSTNVQQPQQSKQPQPQAQQQLQATPKQKPKQTQPPPPQIVRSQQPRTQQPRQSSQKQPVIKPTKQVSTSQPQQPKQQPKSTPPTSPHQPQPQQQQQQKTTVGPVKSIVSQIQKQAPYYPLSSQARVVAASSTAALASMTASSALVVGGAAGRTKQDLVSQSSRGPQRQQKQPVTISVEPISNPVKHAVRKSSVNFVMPPVRQSALPTATRSVLPTTSIETLPNPVTKINPKPNSTVVMSTIPAPITPVASISLSSQAQKVNPAGKTIDAINHEQPSTPSVTKLTTWAVDPHVATLPLIHPTPKSPSAGHESLKAPSTTFPNSTTLITNSGGKNFSAGTESGNGTSNSSAPSVVTVVRMNTNSSETPVTTISNINSNNNNNNSNNNTGVITANRTIILDSGSKSAVGQHNST